MRLDKIKLAGFKSFVDPTTVYFPSDLVGIVGPNGCGKSNTIDAVRWVLGESSAKNLRGESMTDVIFNGSSARKPVGQASIELFFDNSDGRAGGQYASYAEISVRRIVTRDAKSTYYLNGIKCRRRDITDLFAGTGLGPRSYAIIEQGMISRLIESKPEELRAFLEQAAGISKYKDRRKETATRMRNTRENLERLTDVRDEVAKQLQHLHRQAQTAERYQALKLEERQVEMELMALRWRGLDVQVNEKQHQIAQRNNRLEEAISAQRKTENEIEASRDEHVEVTEQFNQVQSGFYQIGAEISRLEQTITHMKERKQQLQSDWQETSQQLDELRAHQDQDAEKCEHLQAQLAEDAPELLLMDEQEEALSEQLADAEEAMHAWQSQWEAYNAELAEPSQRAQVERTKINHLEQHVEQLKQRIGKADEELERVNDTQLTLEIEGLTQDVTHWRANHSREMVCVTEQKAEILHMREQHRRDMAVLDEQKSQLQQLLGKQASLEALQHAALNPGDATIQAWLMQHELHDREKLAQVIRVDNGWEKAVEMVLGAFLEAIGCDALQQYSQAFAQESHALILYDTHHQAPTSTPDTSLHRTLSERVQCPWDLTELLHNVFTADDLPQAMERLQQLGGDASVVTPQGLWLSRQWLRAAPGMADDDAGVLAREQMLRDLNAREGGLSAAVQTLGEQQTALLELLQDKELERDDHQQLANEVQDRLTTLQTKLSAKQTRLEHLQQRREELLIEKSDLETQAMEESEHILQVREVLHEALQQLEGISARREALVNERDVCREKVTEIRARVKQCREQRQTVALQVESMKAQWQSTQSHLQRMQDQVQALITKQTTLSTQLDETAEPQEQRTQELEAMLAEKLSMAEALSDARAAVDHVDQRIRGLERKRGETQELATECRANLDEARIAYEGLMVRRQTVQEAMGEAFSEVDALLAALADDAEEATWRQRLDDVRRQIQRLGNINLAAIDEYAEQSERLTYLDEQHADLTESLALLENAIAKIDRETRVLFKETFDAVDEKLRVKFPKLFGGGSAYLELTGNDLLDTGVTIMARPPGKRNSTIHLLSGGEKALTAIALVFSIFELNPAPFCMLDEVDAPLDEANVGRFSQLVKEMSAQVQFIFITHNKVTMEIANQLSGVTMHEPGVSRIVSVDVDEAVELAAS